MLQSQILSNRIISYKDNHILTRAEFPFQGGI